MRACCSLALKIKFNFYNSFIRSCRFNFVIGSITFKLAVAATLPVFTTMLAMVFMDFVMP
jgi:hypothetical protein